MLGLRAEYDEEISPLATNLHRPTPFAPARPLHDDTINTSETRLYCPTFFALTLDSELLGDAESQTTPAGIANMFGLRAEYDAIEDLRLSRTIENDSTHDAEISTSSSTDNGRDHRRI